jgi:hypothetical protein
MLASDARSLRRAVLIHRLPYEFVGLLHLAFRWSMPFNRKHTSEVVFGSGRQCLHVCDTDRSLENVKAAEDLSYCRLTILSKMLQRCHFEIRPQATNRLQHKLTMFYNQRNHAASLSACSCCKPVMHHHLICSVIATLRRGRDTIVIILHCVFSMKEILWITL